MTISNKFGWLVLTTGNKSEMATGYSTLYGDMAGGFAVIKDVPKMLVYGLCEDLNRRLEREIVPRTVIEKAPSAELRPDQKDEDSLPPYPVLDAILEGYIEDDRSIADLVADGFDRETVVRIARLVDRSEYKRRQAPPACACRRRRSARTGDCRSPTAGPAEAWSGDAPAALALASWRRRRERSWSGSLAGVCASIASRPGRIRQRAGVINFEPASPGQRPGERVAAALPASSPVASGA